MRSLVSNGHLICTKCTSRRIVDAGVAHGRMNRYDRLLDLDYAADLLGQEIAGVGDTDAQALAAGAAVRAARRKACG